MLSHYSTVFVFYLLNNVLKSKTSVDLVLRPYCIEHVRALLLKNNFIAIKSKKEHLSRSKVEDFYWEHESKFFYNRLATYLSSGPSHVHILGRQNEAIKT